MLRPIPNDTAVVLFTSGSEKAPKAVPLTHANILAVERGVVAEFHLSRTDSVLGFLPMFHSFGLVVTTVLPLACGVRIVHHPDPTDAGALARKAAGYRPTLVAGTPTFLGHLLDRVFSGSAGKLVMQALAVKKATPTELAEIRKLLDELQEGGEK